MYKCVSQLAVVLSIFLLIGYCSSRRVRAEDAPTSRPTIGAGAVEHAQKIGLSSDWDENIDWAKLDGITRELAPDRLNWDELCARVTGKPISSFPAALPEKDAIRFMSQLAARLIPSVMELSGSRVRPHYDQG